jgi:hypothetical protein
VRPVKNAGQNAAKAKAAKGGAVHGSKNKAQMAKVAGRLRGNHPPAPGRK